MLRDGLRETQYLAKGLCKSHYAAQWRRHHPENALTHNVRSFYGLPNFPMIPDGWLSAQQRRQLYSMPAVFTAPC